MKVSWGGAEAERRPRTGQQQARKAVRRAMRTRKSTAEGLYKHFNRLDAQRESAEAYVRSQAHEGWRRVPIHAPTVEIADLCRRQGIWRLSNRPSSRFDRCQRRVFEIAHHVE